MAREARALGPNQWPIIWIVYPASFSTPRRNQQTGTPNYLTGVTRYLCLPLAHTTTNFLSSSNHIIKNFCCANHHVALLISIVREDEFPNLEATLFLQRTRKIDYNCCLAVDQVSFTTPPPSRDRVLSKRTSTLFEPYLLHSQFWHPHRHTFAQRAQEGETSTNFHAPNHITAKPIWFPGEHFPRSQKAKN